MSEDQRPILILAVLIGLLLVLYGAWHWTSRSSTDVPSAPTAPPSGTGDTYPGPQKAQPGPSAGGPGMMGPGKMGTMAPGSGGGPPSRAEKGPPQ